MIEKLKTIKERYDVLTGELSDPAIIGNQEKFRTLAQEQASIADIVEAYEKYAKLLDHISQNRELIETEDDEELTALAKEELGELEQELEALEAEIKVLLIPKDKNDDKNVILEIRAGTFWRRSASNVWSVCGAAWLYGRNAFFQHDRAWRCEGNCRFYRGKRRIFPPEI